MSGEEGYLQILRDLLNKEPRKTRNAETLSGFSTHLKFENIGENFPLLTTKDMSGKRWESIVRELLELFIPGHTDSKILESSGVNIWKPNTVDTDGDLGPMYGFNWRHYGADYTGIGDYTGKGYDQLSEVIKDIRKDPHSRRLCITTFNPLVANSGVLWPCHGLVVQFYVSGSHLDLAMYQRSADVFLGLPFNIASYALMLCLVASVVDLTPGNLYIHLGDYHLYTDHIEQANVQVSRQPYKFPKLIVPKKDSIDEYTYEDISLKGYTSHESIKAKMIA